MKNEEEAHAMTLCTLSPNQEPTGRVVLLKEVDRKEESFFFLHPPQQPKGRSPPAPQQGGLGFFLEAHGAASTHPRNSPSRAQGEISRLLRHAPQRESVGRSNSPTKHTHPVLGAPLGGEKKVGCALCGAGNPSAPRLGGYGVRAHSIEFWTGKPDRLHERVLYRKKGDDGRWKGERLAP